MKKSEIKRRRRKRLRARLAGLCILLLLLVCFYFAGSHVLKETGGLPGSWRDAGGPFGLSPGGTESAGQQIDMSGLYSPHAVLMDAESGEILGQKDGNARIFPASLTKIMTAVVTLEYAGNLNRKITVPDDIFPALYEENASMAGFLPGEETTIKSLLYGMLLPSGAECCLACADEVAGSEEEFAELMNEKAAQLGMDDTHFCNSTGLHEEEHYSTAADLAKLMCYALDDRTFRSILSQSRYSVRPTNRHEDGFTVFSTLSSAADSVEGSEAIIGGKTGYTPEAGLCLASFAKIKGRSYVLVTAGAPGDHQSEPYHVMDAAAVYGRLQ